MWGELPPGRGNKILGAALFCIKYVEKSPACLQINIDFFHSMLIGLSADLSLKCAALCKDNILQGRVYSPIWQNGTKK